MHWSIEIEIIVAFALSFLIVYVAIPTIIRVARMAQWFDRPNERKIHSKPIPRLAGVALFSAISISTLLFLNCKDLGWLNYFLVALIILFFIGLKDDILITAPLTKFSGQLLAVSIVIILGKIQITNLHGFFHISTIPNIIGILLTIFTFLVIINSFNFIDGIDGLAAIIGIEAALTFGLWFYHYKLYNYAILSAILIGSLLGYLPFNLSNGKNKIFFGDTGTMLTGLVISVLAIQFNEAVLKIPELRYFPAPAVSFGILILPFYDMLRIIYIRFLTGQKFYQPDQNHIHHIFLRLGFNQRTTLLILSTLNLIFIILSFVLAKYFSIRRLLLIQLILIALIIYIPSHILRKKEENES